mmetsp:Transcript_38307/g.105690  ORF Transcript_38307/g.105690 Transcript_38307/m.105690 type:complete len:248 (+) Transcript_38307:1206-1949(+)
MQAPLGTHPRRNLVPILMQVGLALDAARRQHRALRQVAEFDEHGPLGRRPERRARLQLRQELLLVVPEADDRHSRQRIPLHKLVHLAFVLLDAKVVAALRVQQRAHHAQPPHQRVVQRRVPPVELGRAPLLGKVRMQRPAPGSGMKQRPLPRVVGLGTRIARGGARIDEARQPAEQPVVLDVVGVRRQQDAHCAEQQRVARAAHVCRHAQNCAQRREADGARAAQHASPEPHHAHLRVAPPRQPRHQ